MPSKITSPEIAAQYVMTGLGYLDQEELWAMSLGLHCQVIAVSQVYRGSVNAAIVRPAEVYREAIRVGAVQMILLHNHPSGEVSPSEEDADLTREFVAVGKVIDLPLIDHIIVGRGRWCSLAVEGIAFA